MSDEGYLKELEQAAREVLEACQCTIFYDCGVCEPEQDFDGPDDMPVDGATAPLTVGMLRRLRDVLRKRPV